MKNTSYGILTIMRIVRNTNRKLARKYPDDEVLGALCAASEAYYVSIHAYLKSKKEVPYHEGVQDSPLPKQSLIL